MCENYFWKTRKLVDVLHFSCYLIITVTFIFNFYFIFDLSYINNKRGCHHNNLIHVYSILWTISPLPLYSYSPFTSSPFFQTVFYRFHSAFFICISDRTCLVIDIIYQFLFGQLRTLFFLDSSPLFYFSLFGFFLYEKK
jgi:hypothetical protein